MSKLIFITGGARSGKSRLSVDLAKRISKKVTFIATCVPKDAEMKKRVRLHKKSRPASWKVIEEGSDIKTALTKVAKGDGTVIIDCVGLLVSNLLSQGLTDNKIVKTIESTVMALLQNNATSIIVSNEVGGGIVPDNHLARRFRDVIGISNQLIAKRANDVYIMQAGIPIKIK